MFEGFKSPWLTRAVQVGERAGQSRRDGRDGVRVGGLTAPQERRDGYGGCRVDCAEDGLGRPRGDCDRLPERGRNHVAQRGRTDERHANGVQSADRPRPVDGDDVRVRDRAERAGLAGRESRQLQDDGAPAGGGVAGQVRAGERPAAQFPDDDTPLEHGPRLRPDRLFREQFGVFGEHPVTADHLAHLRGESGQAPAELLRVGRAADLVEQAVLLVGQIDGERPVFE